MTAQHEQTSSSIAKETSYSWPRDIAELANSFWGDLDWPRRVFGPADGALRIEETVKDGTMIVRAEIPGVDPDKDVEISVEDGVLTISAKRETKSEETKDNAFHSEFRYGSFVRRVRMPKSADLEAVTASYRDGVIEIKVPLRTAAVPSATKIEIRRS